MRYIVMCRVSGGLTGTRMGELKEGGRLIIFDTLAAAEERAAQLNTKMNHAFSSAVFKYWAEPYTPPVKHTKMRGHNWKRGE